MSTTPRTAARIIRAAEVIAAVIESALPADQKSVAVALASFADKTGCGIWASQQTIGRLVSKSDRAVRDALRGLEAAGVLVDEPWPDGEQRKRTRRCRLVLSALPAHPEPEESSASAAREPETVSGADRKILPIRPEVTSDDPSSERTDEPSVCVERARARDCGDLNAGQRQILAEFYAGVQALNGGVDAPRRPWAEELMREGATREQCSEAVEAASLKGAGGAYALAVLKRLVREAKAGTSNDDVSGSPPRGARPEEDRLHAGRPRSRGMATVGARPSANRLGTITTADEFDEPQHG